MDESSVQVPPEPQKIVQLTKAVQAKFKLDLFGIDVIIENTTGKYAVIDINAFPGEYQTSLSMYTLCCVFLNSFFFYMGKAVFFHLYFLCFLFYNNHDL